MQHGEAEWTFSIDIQVGHAALTCNLDISKGKLYEHAVRTCIVDMQGHAA
jgi:hypothetical protein